MRALLLLVPVCAALASCDNASSQVERVGVVRTYFISADEVDWDYAPAGHDMTTGQPFDENARVFVETSSERIGKVYRKALYREYTDQTFATLKERPPEWSHLGLLGPLVRAEVGDTVQILFRNNSTRPYSMHAHGLAYDKRSEGALYDDGTTADDKADDRVPPGGSHVYTWRVPPSAGPGPGDPSSILWMYHSHVDEPKDANAGLVGPILVTAAGMGRDDGTPKDVDRELVTMFSVINENASHYIERNADEKIKGRTQLLDELLEDPTFEESNLMHSVNGYVYGNLPGLTAKRGDRVRWYVFGMGSEVDLHTPHWHGNTITFAGMRNDVLELLPMSMKTADMTAENPGRWLFHCHVNDHIDAGMIATYRVDP